MKTIPLKLRNNGYKIVIGSGILSKAGAMLRSLNLGTDAVIVTSAPIARRYAGVIVRSLKKGGFTAKVFEVPDGEKSKSARCAFELLERIASYDVKRKIFVVALGGGVIGDLTGYVAAVYKRGVPYVQIPTTLLAQIDSAIGGKVAIDLPAGKNLVGAFYQPKLVVSDVELLKSLSRRQIRNGLSEAVKYGVISDRSLFEYLSRNYGKLLNCEPDALEKVVVSCSRIKARIVEKDEKETKGIRTVLNFGHTVGHAIEAAGRYRNYQHGEAVALGMRVAADLSARLGLLNRKSVASINEVLSAIGLPSVIKGVSSAAILKTMEHDKKFQGKKNRFVLATGIGSVKVLEEISPSLIRKALQAHL
jgi:3-dehydroquinate synthase